MLLPGSRAFLDLDDLDDIERLDEYVATSGLVILVASADYFTSRACQNEIRSAHKWRKQPQLVHEADRRCGGKPWHELIAECPHR